MFFYYSLIWLNSEWDSNWLISLGEVCENYKWIEVLCYSPIINNNIHNTWWVWLLQWLMRCVLRWTQKGKYNYVRVGLRKGIAAMVKLVSLPMELTNWHVHIRHLRRESAGISIRTNTANLEPGATLSMKSNNFHKSVKSELFKKCLINFPKWWKRLSFAKTYCNFCEDSI